MTIKEELMVITMEECGELIQQCSKVLRFGTPTDNRRLKDEIGDVMCMIELMKEYGIISDREIQNQIQTKRMKLMKWSKLVK